MKKIEYLIDKDSSVVNKKNSFGATPLIAAAEHGLINVVKLLIANNADVNAKDNLDITALIRASQKNHLDVVEYLIINNAQFINDLTPLENEPFWDNTIKNIKNISTKLLTNPCQFIQQPICDIPYYEMRNEYYYSDPESKSTNATNTSHTDIRNKPFITQEQALRYKKSFDLLFKAYKELSENYKQSVKEFNKNQTSARQKHRKLRNDYKEAEATFLIMEEHIGRLKDERVQYIKMLESLETRGRMLAKNSSNNLNRQIADNNKLKEKLENSRESFSKQLELLKGELENSSNNLNGQISDNNKLKEELKNSSNKLKEEKSQIEGKMKKATFCSNIFKIATTISLCINAACGSMLYSKINNDYQETVQENKNLMRQVQDSRTEIEQCINLFILQCDCNLFNNLNSNLNASFSFFNQDTKPLILIANEEENNYLYIDTNHTQETSLDIIMPSHNMNQTVNNSIGTNHTQEPPLDIITPSHNMNQTVNNSIDTNHTQETPLDIIMPSHNMNQTVNNSIDTNHTQETPLDIIMPSHNMDQKVNSQSNLNKKVTTESISTQNEIVDLEQQIDNTAEELESTQSPLLGLLGKGIALLASALVGGLIISNVKTNQIESSKQKKLQDKLTSQEQEINQQKDEINRPATKLSNVKNKNPLNNNIKKNQTPLQLNQGVIFVTVGLFISIFSCFYYYYSSRLESEDAA